MASYEGVSQILILNAWGVRRAGDACTGVCRRCEPDARADAKPRAETPDWQYIQGGLQVRLTWLSRLLQQICIDAETSVGWARAIRGAANKCSCWKRGLQGSS